MFEGSETTSLYLAPAHRTMGNFDILVHLEDMEKAHVIFEKLGIERMKSVLKIVSITIIIMGLIAQSLMNNDADNYH